MNKVRTKITMANLVRELRGAREYTQINFDCFVEEPTVDMPNPGPGDALTFVDRGALAASNRRAGEKDRSDGSEDSDERPDMNPVVYLEGEVSFEAINAAQISTYRSDTSRVDEQVLTIRVAGHQRRAVGEAHGRLVALLERYRGRVFSGGPNLRESETQARVLGWSSGNATQRFAKKIAMPRFALPEGYEPPAVADAYSNLERPESFVLVPIPVFDESWNLRVSPETATIGLGSKVQVFFEPRQNYFMLGSSHNYVVRFTPIAIRKLADPTSGGGASKPPTALATALSRTPLVLMSASQSLER